MSKRKFLIWIVIAAIAVIVGGGLARAGVIEIDGTIHLTIKPSPEAVIKGGPVSGPYGFGPFTGNEPLTLEFIACCVYDPEGGTVTVEWDLDYDGLTFDVDATGHGPVSHSYPDGPYTTYVAVRLTSSSGAVGIVTTGVTVINVPPTADAHGPYSGATGTPIVFTGSATDPSTPDTNAGFSYAWDFDYRGTFAADQTGPGLVAPSATYTQAGTYNVALRVTDKDNGVSATATGEVVVSGTTSLTSYADTFINDDQEATNYGTLTTMDVMSRTDRARRVFLGFDLSSLPASAVVIQADLKIRATSVPSSARQYGLYLLSAGWTESGLNWTNQPGTAGQVDVESTPATANWMTFDVTGSVQDMISGTASNFGWMVRDSIETGNSDIKTVFGTREGTSANRPSLEIMFTIPTAP